MQDELRSLANELNDRSRKTLVSHGQAIVPLKFDEEGEIPETPDRILFKKLNLNDLRFLKAWREADWDVSKAREKFDLDKPVQLTDEQIKRLVKKLQPFREEEAKVKALCQIPTPDWIAAKHVENVYDGGQLDESSHKSLQELAKIEGAYKNNLNVSVTQNVFNLPKLDAETEAKLKVLAQQEAQVIQEAQVVNG